MYCCLMAQAIILLFDYFQQWILCSEFLCLFVLGCTGVNGSKTTGKFNFDYHLPKYDRLGKDIMWVLRLT